MAVNKNPFYNSDMDKHHTVGGKYCSVRNFSVGVVQGCLAGTTLEIQNTPRTLKDRGELIVPKFCLFF